MDPRTWEMRMVAPTQWLNANDRMSWQARAPLIRMWRDAAKRTAAANHLPRGLSRVRVDVHLSFTDDRRRDVSNYAPSVKASWDGIVSYGVIPDDSDKFMEGPFLHLGENIPARRYGPVGELRFVITELATGNSPEEVGSGC